MTIKQERDNLQCHWVAVLDMNPIFKEINHNERQAKAIVASETINNTNIQA